MERIQKEQEEMVSKLLNGDMSLQQLNSMRSDARRWRKIEQSISLAIVNELYKYELKGDK